MERDPLEHLERVRIDLEEHLPTGSGSDIAKLAFQHPDGALADSDRDGACRVFRREKSLERMPIEERLRCLAARADGVEPGRPCRRPREILALVAPCSHPGCAVAEGKRGRGVPQ